MIPLTIDSFEEIVNTVCKTDFIEWEKFKGKTFFITGATGLIGYTLIRSLIYTSGKRNLDIRIIALVRDIQRARERFSGFEYSDENLKLFEGNVEKLPYLDNSINIDYIVHGASKTASMSFVNEPVETIETAVLGTINILRLAKEKNISGMVYLSSMEVYGYPQKGHKVRESDIGALSPQDLRSSYPISKIQCESLCKSYSSEYNLPVVIGRLTQTFGPGVNYNDGRIFAYFGRCVVEHKNIILKTKGETERSYLYTSDAVTAILTLLQKGTTGESYNIADEKTYCSIAQMAEEIAKENGILVEYEASELLRKNGYPDTIYMDLDTSKILKTGWFPQFRWNKLNATKYDSCF